VKRIKIVNKLLLCACLSIAVGCAAKNKDVVKYKNSNVSSRAVAEQPEIAKSYGERGMIKLVANNDYQGAVEDFSIAIGFKPSDPELYVGRGLAYLKYGNNEAAKNDFDKASSLEPRLAGSLRSILDSSR
jgi:Flp pilus assembly protein TadD